MFEKALQGKLAFDLRCRAPSENWEQNTSGAEDRASAQTLGRNMLGVLEGRNARGRGTPGNGGEKVLWVGGLLQGSWYRVCI